MAQSTRPPTRHNSSVIISPPTQTTTEKRPPHVRRKSAKEVVTTEKKSNGHAHRPAPLTRRTTPQHITKSSAACRATKQREDEDERRDSGESFPQFCMTCEKQFVPANNTFLYCSEHCRRNDSSLTHPTRQNSLPNSISPTTPYFQAYSPSSGPDIIPRASPTQSRPRSYFHSEPYTSPPLQPQRSASISSSTSTALASLRELAKTPPISRSSSGVWNYISVPSPFNKSTSTSASQNCFQDRPSSYGSEGYAYAVGAGMDRPLPPRSGPGGYGRVRSIDLVTPFVPGH